jgi:hypothetical protein
VSFHVILILCTLLSHVICLNVISVVDLVSLKYLRTIFCDSVISGSYSDLAPVLFYGISITQVVCVLVQFDAK